MTDDRVNEYDQPRNDYATGAAMTDDLVTRLRYLRAGLALEGMGGDASLVGQAADEIERLRGQLENVQRDRMAQVEVERLREERDYLRHELNNETD